MKFTRQPNKPNPAAKRLCCLYSIGLGYDRIARHTGVKRRKVSQMIALRVRKGSIKKPPFKWRGHEKLPEHQRKSRYQKRLPNFEARLQKLQLTELKKRLRRTVWKWVKFNTNSKVAPILVGCSRTTFIRHIKRQFTTQMSMSNYGTVWELDHILPCKLFDLTKPKQRSACFHYKNFRPLLRSDNRRKSSRFQLT